VDQILNFSIDDYKPFELREKDKINRKAGEETSSVIAQL
jgi:hypothetical protein